MKTIYAYCCIAICGIVSFACNGTSRDTEDRVKSEQKALKKRAKDEQQLDKKHAKENVKFEKQRKKADEKSNSVIEIPKSERGLEEAKRDKKNLDKNALF